jgi:Mg2+/Co2+ transporter CorB
LPIEPLFDVLPIEPLFDVLPIEPLFDVLPPLPVFVVVVPVFVVVVVVVELVVVVAILLVALAFALFAFPVLVLVASQANPKAAKAKIPERANVFFILIILLFSFLFFLTIFCSKNLTGICRDLGTNDNINMFRLLSQSENSIFVKTSAQNCDFFRKISSKLLFLHKRAFFTYTFPSILH